MEPPRSSENEQLRRTLQDVVALSSLSASWLGLGKEAVGAGLLDVSINTLHADAAFLLIRSEGDANIIEDFREAHFAGFAEWIRPKLHRTETLGKSIRVEFQEVSGKKVRIAIVGLGVQAQSGALAIASRRENFPDEFESILISIAANQAAISIQLADLRLKLASSEQRFRALSATSSLGIFLTDLRGHAFYTNAHCQAICGFTADQALGEGWANFVHPTERDQVIQEWTQAVQSGAEFSRNICWVRSDESLCWTRVRATVIVSDAGDRFGLIGTVEDITEQKRTEDALSDSERQFRTLANTIPNLAWMANSDGWIFWYNQRWFEYTGTTPEQMEGWGWQSVHDPATLPKVLERWRRSIQQGNPFEMVFPLRGADGIFRPFLTRVEPVSTTGGKVTRWFGTNTDVSELSQIQDALQDSEERFRTIAETASDAVFMIDENSEILFANNSAIRIFGHNLKELIGQSLTMLMPHYLRHLHEAALTRYKHTGKRHLDWNSVELPGLHKDGTEIPLELSFGESSKDGKRLFTGFARDITERKRMQETLLAGEKAAATGRMAATMAHEINNPLEVVTNILYLLNKNTALDAQGRKFVTMLSDEIARITYITKGTLDLYRGSQTPVRVNISKELDEVLDRYASKLQAKRVILEKRCMFQGEIEGYPVEIRQVFSNLLTNAIEAIEDGGHIVVELSETDQGDRRAGSEVRVSFADDGPGIPEQIRDKLFEPFVSTKGLKGTGLGLWVTRGIVHRHHGTIEVLRNGAGESRGTKVLICLPKNLERAAN